MKVVILGLSITSSWGNGHATNFRALAGALDRRGHELTFLERDVPWYAANRDLPEPPHGRTHLYGSVEELREHHAHEVAGADLVIVGSYVPDGIEVASWVQVTAGHTTAFYDIDTPVTMAALAAGTCAYLRPDQIAGFDVYLSFTSGPTLQVIEERYGSPRAEAFHCLVDPGAYRPRDDVQRRWDLGYLGTYSDDRQPALERLLLEPARRRPDLRFVVAGPQYPDDIAWPDNVERIEHLPPADHVDFYAAQRVTLNVTRADMVAAGWSPSVRLFETAACAVPVVSDRWEGLDSFFAPDDEIFLADGADDVLAVLDRLDDGRRRAVGEAARRRVLAGHTADHRVAQLEDVARWGGRVSTLQARGAGVVDDEIAALGPWFHNLHLPDGRQTAPDHRLGDFPAFKWQQLADVVPQDLSGCRALDIGCNAGYYTFELAERGADVVAIDHDEHYLRQARWAADRLGLGDRIDLRLLGVYDLADLKETFDLVLFMGVLYHLRYPLLALDLVAEKVRGRLVLQTLTMPGPDPIETPRDLDIDARDQLRQPGWPAMAFIEHHLANDPTNWWVPDAGAVEAMVRTTGLKVVERPGHELWICERDRPSYHGPELDVAVGRSRRSG